MNLNLTPGAQRSVSRDIRLGALPEFDWSHGQTRVAMDRMAAQVLDYAQSAVDWYTRRKWGKRFGARVTRLSAILLVLISGVVPPLGEIFRSGGQAWISPLWASVALVLAAGAIGADRFFGFSAAYMRYLIASLKLQRKIQGFGLDWQSRRASLGTAEPNEQQVQDSIGACKSFLADVHEIIQSETESWVEDFTTALSEVDMTARGSGGNRANQGSKG